MKKCVAAAPHRNEPSACNALTLTGTAEAAAKLRGLTLGAAQRIPRRTASRQCQRH